MAHQRLKLFGICVVSLTLATRLWMSLKVASCGVPDSCTYFALASALRNHHHFILNFLFDYQVPHPRLPATGLEYWRPGTSLLIVLFSPFGVTHLTAGIAGLLAQLALGACAYVTALRFTGERILASISFLLCLSTPLLWQSSLFSDSQIFYAAAVGWFLFLFRADEVKFQRDIAAFLCSGLAYLIRNDAILLIGPLLIVLFMRMRGADYSRKSVLRASTVLAGFLLSMAPALILTWKVTGSPFAPGSGRVIFLNDLSEFAVYGQALDRHSWLSPGVRMLAQLRLVTLLQSVHRTIFLLIGLESAFLLGSVRWIRGPEAGQRLIPYWSFILILLGVYCMVLPGIGGLAFVRSIQALLPFLFSLVAIGIFEWSRDVRTAILLGCALVAYQSIDGATQAMHSVSRGRADRQQLLKMKNLIVGNLLPGDANPVVMSDFPAQFAVTTGLSSVPFPVNGPGAVRAAVQNFGVCCLVVTGREADELQGTSFLSSVTPIPDSDMFLLYVKKN